MSVKKDKKLFRHYKVSDYPSSADIFARNSDAHTATVHKAPCGNLN